MVLSVWAVVKDPGGVAAVLPIVTALRTKGHAVLLIANGKAVELLSDMQEEHIVARRAVDVISLHKAPHVLLTSMCSEGGVGRDLVPLLRGKTLTVAVQDMWGVRLRGSWADLQYRPDFITTNDEIGKKIIRDTWKDFPSERIVVTGFAALDKYAAVNVAEEGSKARKALGLGNLPIVLFGGQGLGTSHALGELVTVLNALALKTDCYFIPRPHPRTKEDFRAEMELWQQKLAGFRGRLVVDWFSNCSLVQLVAAAAQRGVVVSLYSTILLEAAALRAPAISILYPGHDMLALHKENSAITQFPLVELGCAAWAKDRSSLRDTLEKALYGTLSRREAQEKYIRVDGNNTHRAVMFVEKLLAQ